MARIIKVKQIFWLSIPRNASVPIVIPYPTVLMTKEQFEEYIGSVDGIILCEDGSNYCFDLDKKIIIRVEEDDHG